MTLKGMGESILKVITSAPGNRKGKVCLHFVYLIFSILCGYLSNTS